MINSSALTIVREFLFRVAALIETKRMLNKEDEVSTALPALCKSQIIAIIALSIVVFSARQKDDVKVDYKVFLLFSNVFE